MCPSERRLPLRLQLYRIINEHNGPVHLEEIRAELDRRGAQYTPRSLTARLSELTAGKPRSLQVRRVQLGLYEAIGD